MKKLSTFILLLLVLLLAQNAVAQQPANLTGTWKLTVETSAGSGSPEFTLKQNADSSLEGTYRGQLGETALKGTLKGNRVYLSFNISGIEIEYDGIVEGDTMKGKVKLGTLGDGTFTGTRKKA